jgi:hypothetical protein
MAIASAAVTNRWRRRLQVRSRAPATILLLGCQTTLRRRFCLRCERPLHSRSNRPGAHLKIDATSIEGR